MSLEHVRELLDTGERAASKAAEEASLSSAVQLLREADDFVGKWLREHPGDPEALTLHAELASRRKDWDAAIVRWTEILRVLPERRSEAYYRLAVAYRNSGSYHRAHKALGRIYSGKMRSRVARETERLLARERRAAARVIGNRVTEVLAGSGRLDQAVPLVEAALELRADEPAWVRDCVRSVVAEIASEADRPAPTPAVPGLLKVRDVADSVDLGRAVFFCGFGWSGSGALFDYFSQAEQAATPFGRSEVLAFESAGGARSALDAARPGGGSVRKLLVEFILQSVLALGGPSSMEPDLNVRKAVLAHYSENELLTRGLAEASVLLFREGLSTVTNPERGVESALKRFFDRLFALKVRTDEVAMFNNCIHAPNVDLVRLVSNSKAVVVMRDPRDQYVSQVYESRDGHLLSCEAFIRKLKTRYDELAQRLYDLPADVEVITVQFEEFILSAELRKTLADRIGVEIGSSTAGYRPEDSVRNVGIYRTYPGTRELAQIETELSPWLFTT